MFTIEPRYRRYFTIKSLSFIGTTICGTFVSFTYIKNQLDILISFAAIYGCISTKVQFLDFRNFRIFFNMQGNQAGERGLLWPFDTSYTN